MRKALLPAASLVAMTMLGAAPANAIECDGNFQVQRNGDVIVTPFCQDNYLAIVAREHGMNVSARALRYSLSAKEQACRLVGHDNRVRDTCAPYRGDDRDGRRFLP